MAKFKQTSPMRIAVTHTNGTIHIWKGKQGRRKEEVYAVVFHRKGCKKLGITITRAGANALQAGLLSAMAKLPITPVTK